MYTLVDILERIEAKKGDYELYCFSQTEYNAIMTFFDLAQEFDNIEDFYQLCVAIPKSFFDLNACLYLRAPESNSWQLMAKSNGQERTSSLPLPDEIGSPEVSYYADDKNLVLPIRGKFLLDQPAFHSKNSVLGILEVYPIEDRHEKNKLFLEKYVNRIGYNMHNKFLSEKNAEHLKFIRTLVADIEHNVIVPNMIYKLYLRRLRGKIMKNIALERLLSEEVAKKGDGERPVENILKEMKEVNRGLTEELENIGKHYANTSLFLETLFRRSHFDQGKLTLRTKTCNMKKDVVDPQLERYMEQFENAGITVDDRLSGIPDEEVISVVDVGLMAQVYANLFSNALKYTEEVIMHWGEKRKYMSYGHEVIRDFFGPGKDGIKYNVFNTGRHIPPEERGRIFEEGYRGSNTSSKPGTGHGLIFIKNAVEIHGGVVGYEATPYGNNFYFIIPKSD